MGSSPIRDTISAQVAKSVDAQDLKSCGPITRTGSIPVLGIEKLDAAGFVDST